MNTVHLEIAGMSCQACVRVVERELLSHSGVHSAAVDLNHGTATVIYDPKLTRPDEFLVAIREAGYEAKVRETTPVS